MTESTIILGDAAQELAKMPAGSVDAIITDPPYGISYKSNRQGLDRKECLRSGEEVVVRGDYFSEIVGDNSVPLGWLAPAARALIDGGALYVFCHWTRWCELVAGVVAVGLQVKNMIVLNKSNHGMGDLSGSYAPKHELLLFATKGRHILRRPNGRGKDVWDVPVKFSGAIRRHPNEKPESWMHTPVLQSTDPGGLVLDPFAGSGSTLAAAASLGRRWIGIEMDETYHAVATERLRELEARP